MKINALNAFLPLRSPAIFLSFASDLFFYRDWSWRPLFESLYVGSNSDGILPNESNRTIL